MAGIGVGQGVGVVSLEVDYSWTLLQGADELLLRVLDVELSYPTPVALAQESGVPLYDDEGSPLLWDGYIHLLRIRKTLPPKFPTGLLDLVTRLCRKYQYIIQITDKRRRPEPGFPEPLPRDFEFRPYQVAAVEAGIQAGHGILVMPPRSGKTVTAMELHRQIALETIWMVPTDRIAQQTARVAEQFFGRHYAVHLVGSRDAEAASRLRLVICTAATASGLSKAFYGTRRMIVIDEFHHVAAVSYRDIVMNKCDHIFHRFGMTGTNFRSGSDELAMRAILSNVVYEVSSTELEKLGYLVPADVLFLPVTAPKLRVPGGDKAFQTGHGRHGIHQHAHRQQLVAYTAAVLAKLGWKTIVLVGTKVQGRDLKRLLDGLLPAKASGAEFDICEFVSTDTDRFRINRILDSYSRLDEVRVLIGTSIVGEGVDLPTAQALVYARGESAEVTLLQAAYRVCTAVAGKQRAIIVDFADRHHRKLMRHSHERLAAYYSEPIFRVSVLDGTSAFVSYLQSSSIGATS